MTLKELMVLSWQNPQLVHARNEHGQTPLHYAIDLNDVEVADLLIHQGAKVQVKDGLGETPLDYTIVQQDVDYELAKLLFNTMLLQNYGKDGFDNLGRPKDKILDGFGRHIYNAITTAVNTIEQEEAINAFKIAAQILQLEERLKSKTIKNIPAETQNKLLSLYEDLYICFTGTINAKHPTLRSALHEAFSHAPYISKKFPSTRLRREHFTYNFAPNKLETAKNIRLETVKEIRARVKLKRIEAAKQKEFFQKIKNNSETIENDINENPYLIHIRNDKGQTPLYIAIKYHRLDVAKLLIDKGADIGDEDEQAEILSIINEKLYFYKDERDKILPIINEKLYYYATGKTSLYVAVENGDLKKVKELGENYPLHINIADDKGRTPLHIAIEHNQFEIADFLIDKGANVNAKDFQSRSSRS